MVDSEASSTSSEKGEISIMEEGEFSDDDDDDDDDMNGLQDNSGKKDNSFLLSDSGTDYYQLDPQSYWALHEPYQQQLEF
jgi:hypothetical protein